MGKVDKSMRERVGNIGGMRVDWEMLAERVRRVRRDVLKELEDGHAEAAAKLASIYTISKQKLETLFKESENHFEGLVLSLNELVKTINYEHSVPWVRFLYLQ